MACYLRLEYSGHIAEGLDRGEYAICCRILMARVGTCGRRGRDRGDSERATLGDTLIKVDFMAGSGNGGVMGEVRLVLCPGGGRAVVGGIVATLVTLLVINVFFTSCYFLVIPN